MKMLVNCSYAPGIAVIYYKNHGMLTALQATTGHAVIVAVYIQRALHGGTAKRMVCSMSRCSVVPVEHMRGAMVQV